MNLSVYSTFGFSLPMETEKPCELYIDMLPQSDNDAIKILWVMEPNEISGMKDIIIGNKNRYDLILAWNEHILQNCENAKLFPHATTWIWDFDLNIEKEYCITTLIGGKQMTPNHFVRQQLPSIIDNITNVPIHLFNSRNYPFSTSHPTKQVLEPLKKNELFYSQFHIAIENVSQKNYFSEKLVDCFQTKTVPIYFGCTNIGDFYDTRGMFLVQSLQEIEEVCESITPETYSQMKPFIEENYNRSIPHAEFRESLKTEIRNFLNK